MRERDFQRALQAFRGVVTLLDPLRFQMWSERGLTVPQARILFLLSERPGQCPGDLAERLQVSPATVTGITDRLARDGLIERASDANDRRQVRLSLTDEGRRIATEMGEAGRNYLRQVFSSLGEERREAIVAALEELAAAAPPRRPAGAARV